MWAEIVIFLLLLTILYLIYKYTKQYGSTDCPLFYSCCVRVITCFKYRFSACSTAFCSWWRNCSFASDLSDKLLPFHVFGEPQYPHPHTRPQHTSHTPNLQNPQNPQNPQNTQNTQNATNTANTAHVVAQMQPCTTHTHSATPSVHPGTDVD